MLLRYKWGPDVAIPYHCYLCSADTSDAHSLGRETRSGGFVKPTRKRSSGMSGARTWPSYYYY